MTKLFIAYYEDGSTMEFYGTSKDSIHLVATELNPSSKLVRVCELGDW